MKSVNSFDIFDTLLARSVENPTDIFDLVEKKYPYPNFKNIRIESQNKSNHTIESIYHNFKILTNETDDVINKLREFEVNTEMENTIPIISNINKIKDNDIFISDMYLTSSEIRKLLDHHGINKNTELYVSSGGKANGSMWEKLIQEYKIMKHYGDNIHSDIHMASKYGVEGVYTQIYKFTELEKLLIMNNEIELCKSFRKFRLMNPYDEHSLHYELYETQITHNIPILLFICNQLNTILIKESLDKVLFLSRDGCLLIKLFSYLYPHYKSIYLHSSRIMNNNFNEDYCTYIKENYDKSSILFDLHGSFNSGRKLFINLFGELPRLFVFDLSLQHNFYEEMTYITSCSNRIEEFNQDYKGTLINFIKGKDIRAPNENRTEFVDVFHSTVDSFINYFNVDLRSSILNDQLFISKYYQNTVCRSRQILANQFESRTLTELANHYNSDKGNLHGCRHHYTIKYEEIINDMLNNKLINKDFSKVDLLEIGLNRSEKATSIPSLLLWDTYFHKNINITGFDIITDFLNFNGKNENINIIIGDQSKVEDLSRLKFKQYDIIIDDGWHASEHQQVTFKTLWDNLKPNGYFIIEDLHYQPIYETTTKTKKLFENWKNGNWMESEFINRDEIDHIKDEIKSIDFYDSQSKNWGDSVKNAFVYIKKI